jgi:LacI family transcriptional regulator
MTVGKRVLEVAKTLDYRPNQSARALVTGRTHRIALQIYRIDNAYASQIANMLYHMLAQQGYEMVLRRYGADYLALESMVDGILSLDNIHYSDQKPKNYQPDIPSVGIGGYYAKNLDFVGINLEIGAVQAMTHLVKTGRKHIVHMMGPSPNNENSVRYKAYKTAMQTAGVPETFLLTPNDTQADALAMLPDYIRTSGCPEAIFCRNDDLAIGCYRALYDLGYRIPEDVLIVGCDGLEIGKYLQPTLSTIDWPLEIMCQTAWDFLQRRIANPQIPQQTALLESKLTIRGSSTVTNIV